MTTDLLIGIWRRPVRALLSGAAVRTGVAGSMSAGGRAAGFVLGLAMLLGATNGLAQADERGAREREQLRRVQLSLREANAERDALRAEKAVLSAQQQNLVQDAARASAQLAALKRELAALQQTHAALDARAHALARDGQLARDELAAAQQQAQQQQASLQQQLLQARAESAARQQANQRLVALLASGTMALRESTARNEALHALGLELVQRWQHKTAAEALAQSEPLFGLGAVRAEDQAQAWRSQLQALQPPAR